MSEFKPLAFEKYLIFEIVGKQYTIYKGNLPSLFIDFQKSLKEGDRISFSKVLSYDNNFGAPYLENIEVKAEVIAHKKLKRKPVLRYKAKKRFKKTSSFRQRSTKVKIVSVSILD